jgi:hypothetical protein
LNCAEYPDGSSSYTETQTVNIAPVFREQ